MSAGGKISDGAKQAAKSVAKKNAKRLFIKYGIPVLAIILLAVCVVAIIIQAAEAIKDAINSIKEKISKWIDSVINQDGIKVKDKDVIDFIKSLEAQGISLKDLGMASDDPEDIKDIDTEGDDDVTDDEKQAVKYVKKFLEASIASETINTHHNGLAIAGCINLKRYNAETNANIDVKYTKDINEKKNAAEYDQYYGLKSLNQIVVLQKIGDGYTEKEIDCGPMVNQYSIPVMYFIDLCLVTQNPRYVDALADAVMDSNIEITLQESVTKEKIETNTKEYTGDGTEMSSKDETSEFDRTRINPLVTTVDTLLFKVTQPYTVTSSTQGPDTKVSTSPRENGVQVRSTITTTTTTYSFTQGAQGDPEIKYHDDDPFPKISRKEYDIPFQELSEAAIGSLTDGGDLLFNLMDANVTNGNLVQITKYVLYKMTNIDFGVNDDNLNLSMFKIRSVTKIYGGTIEEKVWFALTGAGFSEYSTAGAMGNFAQESSFNPNSENSIGAKGLCQWLGGRASGLVAYAASKGKEWTDPDTQIEFLITEISGGEGPAAGYASNELVCYNGCTPDGWRNAQSPSDAAYQFCWTFERCGFGEANMPYRQQMAEQYYNTYHGKTRPSFSGTGEPGDFVQYYQGDYSDVPYGSSNIGACGCGPTSFAMIASTLTGDAITPQVAVEWCGNSYYVWGAGTSWAYFEAATSHFNLPCQCVDLGNNIGRAVEEVSSGNYVISSQNSGIFTSGGHYIVLAGVDENGEIIVKDPNKRNAVDRGYNDRRFTPSEISASAANYWAFETN